MRLGMLMACLLVSACQNTTNLYYWGEYEQLVYDMYHKPGSATPEVQIDKLSLDIEKANNSGQNLPPGVYAHLGLMYAAVGNMPAAESAFTAEKNLFPESAVFIDGMLKRANDKKTNPGKM